MAESKENVGALSGTLESMSKLPLYGTSTEQLQELKDAQTQALQALEQRYAQPNWYNIAAGFLKPQLGGFFASVGSAAEAEAQRTEQQRAQQLPISQMRAQLAQTNLLLGKNKTVSEKIEKWKQDHPGQMPSAAQVMEWRAEAPQSPTVQAIAEQQKLGIEQQAQSIQILDAQLKRGLITKDQYDSAISQLQGAAPVPGTVSDKVPATAQPQPTTPTEPASFGTPSKLLDNLRLQEGGKEDYPVNTQSKAMGPYQFDPLTVQMLHKQGYKFNVMDEKESRAAADYYLQQLLKQHSGDWNKALAAYGGFKKEDPSGYIKNVTKDVDLTKPGPVTKAAEKPQAEFDVPYLKMSPEQLEVLNKRYEPQAARATYHDPIVTSDTHNRLTRLTELLGSEGVRKGTGLLYGEQGTKAAIQKILAQGASVSAGAGGMGANFSVALPVESAIIASRLSPKEQQELREFQQLLSEEGRNDLTAAVRATGGGHLNQAEFTNAMNSILSGSDPYSVLKKHIAVRALQNEREAKIYDAWGEYQTNPKTADKPPVYFFHGKNSPFNRIINEYQKQIQDARR